MIGTEEDTWLQYGVSATPVDEPDRTFGVIESEDDLTFGTFPSGFVQRSDLDAHREDLRRIRLSALDQRIYRRFGSGFEPVSVTELVTDVVDTTTFTEAQARVVVLEGWFGMTRSDVADVLDRSEAGVGTLVSSAATRRQQAAATADVPFPWEE